MVVLIYYSQVKVYKFFYLFLNNMEINEKQIFDLIKEQDFDKIYNLIKSKKIKNLNIRDMNYNYFIQYIINYNQYKIMELLLNNNININLDILDTDGRSLLYNCIKFESYEEPVFSKFEDSL